MDAMLATAAGLAVAAGVLHSVLGERYILVRLLRRELPKLFGSDRFTKEVLRLGWHVTSVAWFGFAAVLLAFAIPAADPRAFVLLSVAATFAASSAIVAGFTRGRHLAWVAFAAIAVLAAGSLA